MTSRLAGSASPYLRAHAGNPVAWFPWGERAFAEAARRDVPVLVSIGYSTCHWCHVMARESFEDPQVAAIINERFVAVKVDREEHPGVDEAYLDAASAFTSNLGWPLTVFTTPDGHAFFAGTYFPPTPRGGLASFGQVLDAVHEAWTTRRDQVHDTAQAVAAALRAAAERRAASDMPDIEAIAAAVRRALESEDRRYGGFAPADATLQTPKFPMAPALRLLQTPAVVDAVPQAGPVAARAMAAMAASSLRDGVDGGFFRYATRRDWTVPHYERMLTDNAGLLEVALDAGDDESAHGIARFLLSVLQQPSGGFAAAQDSESMIDGIVSEGGYYGRDASARRELTAPAVDAKIVTGWNGMAIGALARAGLRLGCAEYIDAARAAADAVLTGNVDASGVLHRASLDEVVSPAVATAADHGLLADGLLHLCEATGDLAYATGARELIDRWFDGGRHVGVDPVLAAQGVSGAGRSTDGDHPSGPSAIAAACAHLWMLGAGDRYRERAEECIRADASAALSEPLHHGALLSVAAGLSRPPRQIVVIAGVPGEALTTAAAGTRADVCALADVAQARALAAAGFSLYEQRTGEVPTAYDCRGFTCRLPVTDPAQLAADAEW